MSRLVSFPSLFVGVTVLLFCYSGARIFSLKTQCLTNPTATVSFDVKRKSDCKIAEALTEFFRVFVWLCPCVYLCVSCTCQPINGMSCPTPHLFIDCIKSLAKITRHFLNGLISKLSKIFVTVSSITMNEESFTKLSCPGHDKSNVKFVQMYDWNRQTEWTLTNKREKEREWAFYPLSQDLRQHHAY